MSFKSYHGKGLFILFAKSKVLITVHLYTSPEIIELINMLLNKEFISKIILYGFILITCFGDYLQTSTLQNSFQCESFETRTVINNVTDKEKNKQI